MRQTRAVPVALAGLIVAFHAGAAARAASDAPATVKLSVEAGSAFKIATAAKIGQPTAATTFRGTHTAQLKVADTQRALAFQLSQAGAAIGLDCDGNGSVDRAEMVALPKDRAVSFVLKLTDAAGAKRDYAITLYDVRVIGSTATVSMSWGRCAAHFAMKGAHEGVPIRLIDDNLDGRFSQDGADAIAIGNAPAAMPLGKTHQIGSRHYDLEVAQDGSSVTLTPRTDLKLGRVELPVRMQYLVLAGKDGQVYDVVTSGPGGLPAGEYSLVYGLLAQGNQVVTLKGAPEALYPITADSINTLRIGPPVRIIFQAVHAGDKIVVSPAFRFVGAGGEQYDFGGAGGIGRPRVVFLQGNAKLSDTAMSYG